MKSIQIATLEESRQNERLQIERTPYELRQYLDKLYPTLLTPEQKSKVIKAAMSSESSFTHVEELVFEFYH
jgi:hypothetical protein